MNRNTLLLLLLYLLFCSVQSSAQLSESFTDGDFTRDPEWTGNTNEFIVNSNKQLQSNSSLSNHAFYLSTANKMIANTSWEFFLQLDFNTSSKNYIDVYLAATDANLIAASNTGYFIRIGGAKDDVSLFAKDQQGEHLLLNSLSILNKGKNKLKIKVTCNGTARWSMYHDNSASGNFYASDGSVKDIRISNSFYFGIAITQSTSSFFKKHFLDDIIIKPFFDVQPGILSCHPVNRHTVDILFNKPVKKTAAENLLKYNLNNIGSPESATLDPSDQSFVHLIWKEQFPSDITLLLSVKDLEDLDGNTFSAATSFTYHFAKRYDVLIDEIMADPIPVVGLPDAEWIELVNRSGYPIDLKGWKLKKGGQFSTPLPDSIILTDSFLIICSEKNMQKLSPFGRVIGIPHFPTLNNKGETLSLLSDEDNIIHTISYTDKWYHDVKKKTGGYTMEMIDPGKPCYVEDNWAASVSQMGGTPGNSNSLTTSIPGKLPFLKNAVVKDSKTLALTFNDEVDPLNATNVRNYIFSEPLLIDSISFDESSGEYAVHFKNELISNRLYTVSAPGINDCTGAITDDRKVNFAITSIPSGQKIVINEILYLPYPGGATYVELYNNSEEIFDLKDLSLAILNRSDLLVEMTPVSSNSSPFLPHHYLALTTDTADIFKKYFIKDNNAFKELDKMPVLSKDSSRLLLISGAKTIDQVNYSSTWQDPLITNPEGVSLERSTFNGSSDASNFHSASSSAGYGTPGYENSDLIKSNAEDNFNIYPETFSPDNDGIDDVLNIHYYNTNPGNIISIQVFETNGKMVKSIEKNGLAGMSGNYNWNGIKDTGADAAPGIYIINIQLLNTKTGNKEIYKKAVVLIRKDK